MATFNLMQFWTIWNAVVCLVFRFHLHFMILLLLLFFIYIVARRSPAKGNPPHKIPRKTAATRKLHRWMHIKVIRQQRFRWTFVRCAKVILLSLTIPIWIAIVLWCANYANRKHVKVHSALFGSQRISTGNAATAIILIPLCMCRPMIGFSISWIGYLMGKQLSHVSHTLHR